MFESIGRSFELVRTSWNILMDDKKLLVFPVLSGIVTLIVILSFFLPLLVSGTLLGMTHAGPVVYYGLLFLFYVASYFVVIFFNTALISCVNAKLNGKDMSVGEGISNAANHLPAILGWAIVSATVGIVLHLLERRSGFLGQIVFSLLGGAWALVTYFVVPVLVLEDKGVFAALGESFSLIKKTWGESIVGSVGMAVVFVGIGVIAALCVIATMLLGNAAIFLAALALFLILVVILAVVYYAMQAIYVTALYTYAKTGTVPSAFHPDLIQNAFAPKQIGPGNI
ncbi:DUF6159 family protein [Methanoregula sp.]|uniref:DUF6159 family protein n=1 Tax=Methanoregula sp. TaxID=2052170 RepID=UPI003C736AE3